jgi:hypothetical protein
MTNYERPFGKERIIAISSLENCEGTEIGYRRRKTFRQKTVHHSFNKLSGVYIKIRQERSNAEIFPNAKTKTKWSIHIIKVIVATHHRAIHQNRNESSLLNRHH